ncbi:MAG: hypothetical protein OXG50_06240 [bacterium]|nr:hypothetical protein [bacterium]
MAAKAVCPLLDFFVGVLAAQSSSGDVAEALVAKPEASWSLDEDSLTNEALEEGLGPLSRGVDVLEQSFRCLPINSRAFGGFDGFGQCAYRLLNEGAFRIEVAALAAGETLVDCSQEGVANRREPGRVQLEAIVAQRCQRFASQPQEQRIRELWVQHREAH